MAGVLNFIRNDEDLFHNKIKIIFNGGKIKMFSRKIFGLDISDHSLEALVLKKTSPVFGKIKIASYARMIMRGEVVKNGLIKNKKKLQENIVKLLESAQPKAIKTPYCIISLPESQVFTAVFKLPAGLKQNEIMNTIPFKAEEVIPFKPSEIYFDFKTIYKKGPTQEIFYVAVPIKVVDSYVEALNNVGLKPVAFDLESISLARALLDKKVPKQNAKLIMDIGARNTNLNIFDRGGIRQSLSIRLAGDRFTKSIAKSLKIKEKEASELKRTNGFDPKKQKGKVLLVLQKELKRIVEESKKIIEYYQTDNQRKIDEVILAGGSALMPQIDQYLADNLGIKTDVGEPLARVADPAGLVKFKGKSVLFSNVLGLALRGVKKDPIGSDINLLPVITKFFGLLPKKEERRAWKLLYIRLAILVIVTIILGGLIVARNKGVDFYKLIVNPPKIEMEIDANIDAGAWEDLINGKEEKEEEEEIIEETKPTLIIKTTTVGYINVRDGAGVGFAKIGEIESGSEHEILAEENGWYQFKFDGENLGWVSGILVDVVEPEAQEKEPEEEGEILGEDIEVLTKVIIKDNTSGYLNVRKGPGINFEKIDQVLPGEEYFVLDKNDLWYQIELSPEESGWVYSTYVKEIDNN